MPREVAFIPAFTKLQYEGELARTEAIASIPRSIAQALLVYSQIKSRDELERIAIYDRMLETYRDRMPQEAMSDFDRVLRNRYKVGLPKDPATGAFMTPSPTVDDMIAREARGNPQLLTDAVEKKLTGYTKLEMKMAQDKIDATKAHNHAMEVESQARTEIAKARALEAANRGKKDDEASDIVAMPDGTLKHAAEVFDEQTNQFPPGTVMLMGKQADRAIALMNARTLEAQRQATAAREKAQLELDKSKALNYIAYGPGAAQWNIIKQIWANKNTTNEMRQATYPQIVDLLKHAGVSEENIPQFMHDQGGNPLFGFLAKFMSAAFGANGLGPQIELDQAQKGVTPPPVGGQRKTSSGRVFTLEELPTGTQTPTTEQQPAATTTSTIP